VYQRIIVPLDGSERAEAALPHAVNLSRPDHAPILLVRVVGYPYLEQGNWSWALQREAIDQVVNEETAEAESYLQDVSARLAANGLSVAYELRRGAVDRAILDEGKSGDVIVIASHGRGGLARWFLGSVAEDVIRSATVPVLLIRTASVPAAPPNS
jgi:nucleotide-binding universal stress UspA family protein